MLSRTRTTSGSETPFMNGARRSRPFQGRCGMAASLVALALLLATQLAPAAHAQSSQGLFWQCVPASSTDAQPKYCPVSSNYPLPVTSGTQSLTPVAGAQRGVSIATSTGMTIPTGATTAIVQAQGTNTAGGICLFWQDDGTAPTGTAGQALAANNSITVPAIAAFKMIAATGATCTASISYYK